MSHKKKNSNSEDPGIHFLHDLLNHTHGLKLYLESCQNGIDDKVKQLIYKEVQALEEQIANQFNHLVKKVEVFDVASVIEKCFEQFDLYHLNYEYLPIVDGESMDLLLDQQLEIDVDSFNRLIKNITKNIYLWSDRDFETLIRVEFINDQMKLSFKNKISKQMPQENISNGIGLKSMEKIAKNMGISLTTGLDGDYWQTSLQIKMVGYEREKLAS